MTIIEKIEAGEYENKLPFEVPNLIVIDPDKMTGRQVREARESNNQTRIVYRHIYRAAEAENMKRFASDLAAYYGFSTHPKADLLFKLAWDYGHSSGLTSVVNYYEEFSELLS